LSSKLLESMSSTSFVAVLTAILAIGASGYVIRLTESPESGAAVATANEITLLLGNLKQDSTITVAVSLPPHSNISFFNGRGFVNLDGTIATFIVNGMEGYFVIDSSGLWQVGLHQGNLEVQKYG